MGDLDYLWFLPPSLPSMIKNARRQSQRTESPALGDQSLAKKFSITESERRARQQVLPHQRPTLTERPGSRFMTRYYPAVSVTSVLIHSCASTNLSLRFHGLDP